MKPHVLAVSFFSSQGAVADNFHTLALSLARQSSLSILTAGPMVGRPVPGLVAACYLDFPKHRPLRWISPGQWLELTRFARRELYDLVFLYSEHPLHVPVELVARARRSLFWCLDPAPHSGSIGPTAAIYELAKNTLMRRADRIVVACDGLRRDIVRRYGVPDTRVISSFHGVLENLVFPDIGPGLTRDIDILFFGRLESYKGVDVLVDAHRLLRERNAGNRVPRLVIAGNGPYPVPDAPGITREIRYVPDRELATMVARSRIVVMPYRDATGSQVPQTAFTYGTPVIATAVGCLSEYVIDGTNGLLVPPGDPQKLAGALERLLTNADLWTRLSDGARRSAQDTFSNDALTARLLSQALGTG